MQITQLTYYLTVCCYYSHARNAQSSSSLQKKLFLVADFNTTLRSQNDWTHSLVYLANEREGCLFLFGVIPRKKKSLIVLLSFIFTFFSVSGKSPKAQNSDLVNYKSFVQYLDWKQQRKTASKLPLFSEEGRDLSRY